MKWLAVKIYSMITGKVVVDFFGSSYIVSGSYVRRIR